LGHGQCTDKEARQRVELGRGKGRGRGRGTVRVRLGKIPLDNVPLFNTQEREALLAQIQEILAASTG